MTQNILKPIIYEMVGNFLDESDLCESTFSDYIKSKTSDAIQSKINKTKRYIQDRTGITAIKGIKKDYDKFKSSNNLS